MLKLKPLYLSLLSGLLLIVAWPPLPTAFILFIGLVPLLLIHHQLEGTRRSHLRFWGWVYLALFIFNTGATWWVWNASPSGCIMMLVMNSLLMSLPFLGFSLVKQVLPKIAYPAFALFYLGFEYWHFNWNASWPWLTLGKGFASMPFYIQWYEYTGEMGGSALVLVINILVARSLINKTYGKLWQPGLVVIGFGLLSGMASRFEGKETSSFAPLNCVISQPNIDPYTEKFGSGDNYLYPEIQLDYAMEAAQPYLDDRTDLLLFPETAIVGANDESQLNTSQLLRPLLEITRDKKLRVLAGAETYAVFRQKDRPSITARFDSLSVFWYDSYNTAMLLDSNVVRSVYHKSRLVPGVEKMPFEFLEWMSIKLGGTSGSLGTSDRAINFSLANGVKIAPLICYESVFGDYANEFVKDGANVLAVVTNDGWWGETPGYQQHLMYGAIRCIETRREMVRSANTGVSAKIDKRGNITQSIPYKKRGAFACQARPLSYMTFYVKYGNLVGKIASLLSILILVWTIIKYGSGSKNEPTPKTP